MTVNLLDSWIRLPHGKGVCDACVAGACAGLEQAVQAAGGTLEQVGFAVEHGDTIHIAARLRFPGWAPRDWDARFSLKMLDTIPPEEIRATMEEVLADTLAAVIADEAMQH